MLNFESARCVLWSEGSSRISSPQDSDGPITIGDDVDARSSEGVRRRPHGEGWAGIVGVAGLAIWLLVGRDVTVPDGSTTTIGFLAQPNSPIGDGPDPVTTRVSAQRMMDVELLEGAHALRGEVALTHFPHGTGNSVWVLKTGGGIARRDDVPLWPGDFAHPMLLTEGRIVFADLDFAYLLTSDLSGPASRLAEASFVVPGADPGLVWLAGESADSVTPFDVQSGALGQPIDVAADFWWPVAGVAGGLIVYPIDEVTFGRMAYWTTDRGLQAIDVPNSAQGDIVTAAGDLAVVMSRDATVTILDVVSGETIRTSVDLGEGDVRDACLSPQAHLVAISGTGGETEVIDAETGTGIQHLTGVYTTNAMGWSSSDQLIYITDVADETRVQALDVVTGSKHDIARLTGAIGWWLTAAGAMC